ncbi:MAG: phage tail protein [Alphaproteobacteria bacterium]|nr:phage tail protein [Alphaproteobacteria bacterium]
MPDLTFIPVFTDAGRAKVAEAYGLGTSATIKEIAIGTGSWAARETVDPYAPTEAALEATALVAERVRQPVFLGGNVAPNQVVMSVVIPGDVDPAGQFFFGEVGIFLDDGTLLAVAAVDAPSGFGWRGAASHVLRFVLSWSQLPNNSITVEFSGDAGLNATFLAQQQLLDQIRQAVIEAGLTWNPNDPLQLSSAIAVLGRAYDEIRKPSITSPANGAVDVGETPTIAGDTYYSLYSVEHVSTTTEIATDADFDNSLGEQNGFGSTSVAVAGGVLATDTTYFVRLRYTDALGQMSAWSDTISFSTGATFVTVAQPANISPANGAAAVSVTPTLTASAFAVSGGGADTHQSSQWIVEEYVGPTSADWLEVWGSGEVAGTASITPGLSLMATTTYRFKVRYRGATYGWSDYSAATTFTTSVAAGSYVDATPGTRQFTVPANVSRIRVRLLGAGASGGGYGGAGAGGGGAGGAQKTYDVVAGQIFPYTLGTPGQGVPSGNWGQNGGTSTFGSDLSATGGLGGQDGSSNAQGGQGGTGSGGDINGTGGAGGNGGVGAGAVNNGSPANLIGGGGGASGGYEGEQRYGGAGADIGANGQNNGPSRGPAAIDGAGGAGAGFWQSISGSGGNPKLVIEWGTGI